MININRTRLFGILLTLLLTLGSAAQEPQKPTPPPMPPQFKPTPNDTLISPEIQSDRRVTFRLYAPQSKSVKVRGEWATNPAAAMMGGDLERADDGVWSATLGPLPPGIYRYSFSVDEIQVADPRNPNRSESLNFAASLIAVPGLEFEDVKDIPHGAVQTIWYKSTALRRTRRMHIYTPPGYEKDRKNYPVFYLLHGAGDSDDSWTSVGHAGFILDNLIAAGQAVPMIVVMPAGHTTSIFRFGDPRSLDVSDFEKDFTQDVMPYVEGNYRVIADRGHRAIAGLSMGGLQTLNLSMANPNMFAYIGVFSSGWFAGTLEKSETTYAAGLNDAKARDGLKLLWFATGKDDFVMEPSKATVALLKRHGFNPEFHETDGAHTWMNWRAYLHEFAPRLFR
jgi:enterochelin esterase-like enzyme